MSHIIEFSPLHLNDDQKIAAGLIERFLNNNEDQVFILKGHAGTGKTTLMNAVVKYIRDIGRQPVLLASTGRASKILADKVMDTAETVHKHIYSLTMDDRFGNENNPKLVFELRFNTESEKAVYIIDEASMLSNHQISGGFLNFGTGRLLTDLFRYLGKRQVIFVGDAAQLPPVNCSESPAMWKELVQQNHNVFAQEFTLETVMRFSENSGINENAHSLRKIIYGQIPPKYFKLKASPYPEIPTYPLDSMMTDRYAKQFKLNGAENQIFIAYSNKTVTSLNQLVRRELGLDSAHIAKGEWFIANQNNYLHEVSNGDHMELIDFDSKTETRADLRFRRVTLRKPDYLGGRVVSGMLIDDLLHMDVPNLPFEREQGLFKDFAIRMSQIGIRPKTQKEAFLQNMLKDPYLNALRLKYGYAITCHKAQGGEWPEVFMLFEPALFHPNNAQWFHRWVYTAITRASQKLHLRENLIVQ